MTPPRCPPWWCPSDRVRRPKGTTTVSHETRWCPPSERYESPPTAPKVVRPKGTKEVVATCFVSNITSCMYIFRKPRACRGSGCTSSHLPYRKPRACRNNGICYGRRWRIAMLKRRRGKGRWLGDVHRRGRGLGPQGNRVFSLTCPK